MGNQKNSQKVESTKSAAGKIRLEKETNELRGEVSILHELIRGIKVKSRILNRMKKKIKWRN